jgi:hypothetical protein
LLVVGASFATVSQTENHGEAPAAPAADEAHGKIEKMNKGSHDAVAKGHQAKTHAKAKVKKAKKAIEEAEEAEEAMETASAHE